MRHSPAWMIGRAIVIVLLSGFVGSTMVRLAPGFGIDERLLDPRLSAATRAAIESEYSVERNPLKFYGRFLSGLLRGDGGRSMVFGQPVGQLIRERAPATIQSVAIGLSCGWIAALVLAIAAAVNRSAALTLGATALSGGLLSIPAAVLATICLLLRLPPSMAIAAAVFPRIFPHAYAQFRAGQASPHVTMARAGGIPPARLFLFYVAPPAFMPLIALAGVSMTLALGVSVPVEALADVPGIGQLAWRAALGRDLPVLVAITLLLTTFTVFANIVADIALARIVQRES